MWECVVMDFIAIEILWAITFGGFECFLMGVLVFATLSCLAYLKALEGSIASLNFKNLLSKSLEIVIVSLSCCALTTKIWFENTLLN
jgi:hypothetical protein